VWAGVEEAWREVFQLAWEAHAARTIPVGAVVVDADGAILARGRNRIFEQDAPPSQLANSRLAHAEVNALAQLGMERTYGDCVLLTTLEPCALCVGAASLSRVPVVRFAAPDVYSGGAGLRHVELEVARQLRIAVEGPLDGPLSVLGEALHLAFFVDRGDGSNELYRTYRERRPQLFPLAEQLVAARDGTLDEALALIDAPRAGPRSG
jgi:tRNA(Arg) A34 adenosine deaminase TadA